jgi:hypothetical protein
MFEFVNTNDTTYVVRKVSTDETIDSIALNMLLNNNISSIAPIAKTQLNDEVTLRYEISSKISLRHFLVSSPQSAVVLSIMKDIVEAVSEADAYMISQDVFILDLDFVFIDVNTNELALICLPIAGAAKADFPVFLKQLLSNVKPATSTDYARFGQIVMFLNAEQNYTFSGLRQLVRSFDTGMAGGVARGTDAPVPTPSSLNVQQIPPARRMATPPYSQEGMSQSGIPQPGQIPAHVQPPQIEVPQAAPTGQSRNAGAAEKPMTWFYLVNHYSKENKAIFDSQRDQRKAGDAGQDGESQAGVGGAAEKPMTWFYLVNHYSRENKAIFDAQRQQAKSGIALQGTSSPVQGNSKKKKKQKSVAPRPSVPASEFAIPGQDDGRPGVPQQPQAGLPAQPTASRQGMSPQQFQPQVHQQPQIVQSPQAQQQQPPPPQAVRPSVQETVHAPQQGGANFGGTVVLGGSTAPVASQTTVLGASSSSGSGPFPMLVRRKNGERIVIKQNEFRLGRSSRFADYVIGDNSNISSSHAVIYINDTGFYIFDTNSTNHTSVNGRQIPPSTMVKIDPDSVILLADEEFSFQVK